MIPLEVDVLARTIYCEARGESVEGKFAVGAVIMNRVESPRFRYDENIIAACVRYRQFSCWNKNDPNFKFAIGNDLDWAIYYQCVLAALRAMTGEDPTKGSCHYHTKAVDPVWSRDKTPCYEVGNHVFFNDVD